MIISAHTACSILTLIASAGTVYDEIIDNIIAPNYHQKNELISEIAISFLSNETKVNQALEQGYFNYYFINVVKNQVHSKTSSFHKNVRKSNVYAIPVDEIDIVDEQDDLEYKELNERQNDILNDILSSTKTTWFDAQIFRMYYEEGMTYREIEERTQIDHCLAFTVIKKIKNRIKKEIELKGLDL